MDSISVAFFALFDVEGIIASKLYSGLVSHVANEEAKDFILNQVLFHQSPHEGRPVPSDVWGQTQDPVNLINTLLISYG